MNKKINIFILGILIYLSTSIPTMCDVISGQVNQNEIKNNKSKIVDSMTQAPISGAAVSIPNLNYKTKSAKDGSFELNTDITKKVILSVEKEGYRPFSLTIDKNMASKPLKLGIERTQAGDITIQSDLCHLGDDVFSDTSANSSEFRIRSSGPYLSKSFKIAPLKNNEKAVLIIGSIIGLDTKLAKEMGQNQIAHVYSSPAEIYFNGERIGELNLNGDNQEIEIPRQLIRTNNELTIKTGRNLFQHAYIDYDDIEIAGIRLEIKQK